MVTRTRLLYISVVSTLVLAMFSLFGIYQIKASGKELARSYETDIIPMQLIFESNNTLLNLQRRLFSFALTDSPNAEETHKDILKLKRNLDDSINSLYEIGRLTEEEIRLLQDIKTELDKVLPSILDLFSAFEHKQKPVVAHVIKDEIEPAIESIDRKMQAFYEIQKVEIFDSIHGSIQESGSVFNIGFICLSGSVILWIGLCLIVIFMSEKRRQFLDAAERWFRA